MSIVLRLRSGLAYGATRSRHQGRSERWAGSAMLAVAASIGLSRRRTQPPTERPAGESPLILETSPASVRRGRRLPLTAGTTCPDVVDACLTGRVAPRELNPHM